MSALLELRGLSKRFGGLVATDALDLAIAPGEIHALIGPNGAGKTTVIAQIAGEIRPDAGSIRLAGADITDMPVPARVRAGLTRSFQVTSLLPQATALENVAMVEQLRQGHSFRFWRDAARDPARTGPAMAMLERVGLAARAAIPAEDLAHGEQRQLELAMALATQPRLLLLDEPMAGLGPTEFGGHDRAARRAEGACGDAACGARHGRGVRAGRPRDGVAAWPRHRLRHAGFDPGQPSGARRLSGRGVMLLVRGLQATYGHSQVLFGIDLDVGAGEVVSLMGRNGMGKTTTIRCVMGLMRGRAGEMSFAGRNLASMPSHAIARLGIGLVPEGRQVFPTLTVHENLVATSRPGAWTLARIHALFPRLAERAWQRAATLSGGEQQMLAIGRALMTNPRLLVLDEATEGLAPLVRAEIWACLAALKAEGQSILVVDKNLAALAGLADRMTIIEKGRTVWSGTPSALAAEPGLAQRFLGV